MGKPNTPPLHPSVGFFRGLLACAPLRNRGGAGLRGRGRRVKRKIRQSGKFQGRSKVRIRVLCAVAAFGRKPPKFHVAQGLAAPEDGGGLPSAATIVLARSGFRQKAAKIPRPSWLGGDFRAALGKFPALDAGGLGADYISGSVVQSLSRMISFAFRRS